MKIDFSPWGSYFVASFLAALPTVCSASVSLKPGNDVSQIVSKNPAGTIFNFAPGLYRLKVPITPLKGDIFIGAPGRSSIISGATLLTSFKQQDPYWTATVGVPASIPDSKLCWSGKLPNYPLCVLSEDLYSDNVLLTRTADLTDLTAGANGWFLDYASGTLYVAQDPTGHNLELTTTHHAFVGSAANVSIEGFVIEKFAATPVEAAVQAFVFRGPTSSGWILQHNEIRLNHGFGVRDGHAMKILNNYIHHNGHTGIGSQNENVLIEGNEIAFNNLAHYSTSGGIYAACVGSSGLTVRNNYAHENQGQGMHTDGDCNNVLYEGNRVESNVFAGIEHEISHAAVIRYNLLRNEGFSPIPLPGAAIWISTSDNVSIYGNTVVGSRVSIAGGQYPTGVGRNGQPYALKNLYVHDNVMVQTANHVAGIVSNPAFQPDVFTSWGNRFESNSYQIANGVDYFWGKGRGIVSRGEWVAEGQDVSGSWIPFGKSSFVSAKFTAGQIVATAAPTEVWSLPSSSDPSSKLLGTVPAGSTATVTSIQGPIYSGHRFWWHVSYGKGLTGWSLESSISGTPLSSFSSNRSGR